MKSTKYFATACALSASLFATKVQAESQLPTFRPPAVPLVVSDPYLSIWSESDTLTGDVTRHWTKHPHPLTSLIRIDGVAYRIMGVDPADVPTLPQKSVTVLPTRTIYVFEGAGIKLTLTFLTPVLPDDLNILTRPVTYISWTAQAIDGKSHQVSAYFDAAGDVAVNTTEEAVIASKVPCANLDVLRVGTVGQPILATSGDDTRIDWGYFYLAAPKSETPTAEIADGPQAEAQFASSGSLPPGDGVSSAPKSPADGAPHLVYRFKLGTVAAAPVSKYIMVSYDEIYSINYFWKYLRPYWRRNGATPVELLTSAANDYQSLIPRCQKFDNDLIADLTYEGGSNYAIIGSLAYRQAFGGTGIAADSMGKPLLFTKEDTSNGDIATVDVIFPANPIFLLFSPTLAKASLVANLDYSASKHWKFPNAPHDLGTYPIALGRDDGGEGMPVEESGNIIILCDAIAQEEGNVKFATHWWPQLTQWVNYLAQYGLDPENQLCTDDFMGPSPHNANLSVKAIVALAAYGDLCKRRGDGADYAKFTTLAKSDAVHWIQTCDTGDHSLLEFGVPGTWSEKYNLVWDRLLGLNVFPPDVAAKEVSYYKASLQPYGLPLDSRTKVTETPWTYWSAALAANKSDFEALTDPLTNYMDQTTTRDPLSDSFITNDVHSGGMHARPVVGGVFIKMLSDRAIWLKWASADKNHVDAWGAFPNVQIVPLIPASDTTSQNWNVTTKNPGSGWTRPGFDDSAWEVEQGAFGNDAPFPIRVQTFWNTDDIWLRRTVTFPANFDKSTLKAWLTLSGSGQIYINGVPAVSVPNAEMNAYTLTDLHLDALAGIKPGKNTFAVHVTKNSGEDVPQIADFGLVNLVEGKTK